MIGRRGLLRGMLAAVALKALPGRRVAGLLAGETRRVRWTPIESAIDGAIGVWSVATTWYMAISDRVVEFQVTKEPA
jgi:hypothetical protein